MSNRRNKLTTTVAVVSGMVLTIGGITACNKAPTTKMLLSEARQYQQKGDNNAAVIQLKNVLQKNPDDVEARYILGTVYNEKGDAISAEKEIRKALSLGMNPTKALPDLSKALLMQGEFQKVLDETRQMQGVKTDAAVLTLQGNAYLALGKGAEAKEAFELALKNKTDFPEALIGLAKYSIATRDMDAATRFSEQAVSKNPTSADTWLFQGDLLRAQGKIEPALAAYDQVLKLKPGNSAAHISKANLEIGLRKFDAAKADIAAARKSMPNALMVFYTQALLDYSQGKPAAALESLQQVLRGAPEHMPSVLLAGAVQYALGSMPQAEHYLNQYLEKDPKNLYARKLLASTLLKSGQEASAHTVLAPALKDGQQDAQLFALAGEVSMQTKDFAKATEYFEKATVLAPQAAILHTALGLSTLAQGENSRAVAELEMATSLDKKSARSGILLILTHLRLKEFDKALAAVKAAEKEQPDNASVQNLKGGIYLGKNDVHNARISFEKALSIQPAYFSAIANLAQLDVLEKKPEVAKKRFETLLKQDKKNTQAMIALASLALFQGQKEEATTWLERASNENPAALQPAILLAGQYLRNGEKQKALNLAQKLQVTNAGNPELLDILAQAQFANGDKAASLESYNKLAVIMPKSAPAQFRIAQVYLAMEDLPAASDALKKTLSLKPDYLDAQLAQAALEVHKGMHEKAIVVARQIQKQQATLPVGYILEGDVLMAQKKPALAVKAYEQAFILNKSGPLMIKLHGSLKQAGQDKEADSRLLQWLKEHPADTSARMYLGTVSLLNQQNKAAIEQFQAILQNDQKNVVVLNNLALAYQQDKDPHALEYAEKAHQLAADNPAILDTLGWILIEQGNTSRGLPLLKKATALVPEAMEIRYHLVLGLIKSGDKATARKELEQLLASGKNFSRLDEAKSLLTQL
ncbi:MAG: XrtA/PEP-CTERM system TPR-repeat protein PrsT [Oxalobacteraceae bacterium]